MCSKPSNFLRRSYHANVKAKHVLGKKTFCAIISLPPSGQLVDASGDKQGARRVFLGNHLALLSRTDLGNVLHELLATFGES